MNTEPFNELVYYPGVDHPKEKKMFEEELNHLEKIYTEREKELRDAVLNSSAIWYLQILIDNYKEIKDIQQKLNNIR